LASSSSNKQPLLIDRPLHSFATIGGVAGLTSATNFNTPSAAGMTLLVDCSANDGAVVDSISVIITEASTTTSTVLAFLSTASSASGVTASNSALVASVAIPGGSTAGQRVNMSLPPLSVPVPNLASPAATMTSYPTETDKKNTGLFIPSTALLYVGVSAALSAPSASTRVHVFAQGGFY
jgi:hypothetical protein